MKKSKTFIVLDLIVAEARPNKFLASLQKASVAQWVSYVKKIANRAFSYSFRPKIVRVSERKESAFGSTFDWVQR